VVCAGFAVRAVLNWRSSGSPLALLLLAGGLISTINEAPIDALGLCWYRRPGMLEAYSTIAPVPLWVVLAYGAFFGGAAHLLYVFAKRGLTQRQLWACFGAFVVAEILSEVPDTALHLYSYYGHQPFKIGGMPLYWVALNGPGLFITAAVLLRLPKRFTGWRVLTALALPSMTYAIGGFASGWPVFSVLHMRHASGLLVQLAGVATIGLGLLLLSFVIPILASDGLFLRRSPATGAEDSPVPSADKPRSRALAPH
jgi:hypothetical protein